MTLILASHTWVLGGLKPPPCGIDRGNWINIINGNLIKILIMNCLALVVICGTFIAVRVLPAHDPAGRCAIEYSR